MRLEEALSLLKQTVFGIVGRPETGFRGTIQEHQTVQEALQVVESALTSKKSDTQCSEKKGQKK